MTLTPSQSPLSLLRSLMFSLSQSSPLQSFLTQLKPAPVTPVSQSVSSQTRSSHSRTSHSPFHLLYESGQAHSSQFLTQLSPLQSLQSQFIMPTPLLQIQSSLFQTLMSQSDPFQSLQSQASLIQYS